MTLVDLRDGDSVFIDANIFIYHFGGRSAECREFLERCARQALWGYTGTSTITEVIHRLMIAKAIEKRLVTTKTAVKQLKERQDWVRQLTIYNDDVRQILQMNLTILSLTPEILSQSEAVRKNEGLLTNDSVIVALMQDSGLTKLASADRDFELVTGLDVHKPGDL
jgi:predicted nucleic acid-binding protein